MFLYRCYIGFYKFYICFYMFSFKIHFHRCLICFYMFLYVLYMFLHVLYSFCFLPSCICFVSLPFLLLPLFFSRLVLLLPSACASAWLLACSFRVPACFTFCSESDCTDYSDDIIIYTSSRIFSSNFRAVISDR